ncbi:iron transporter FeoB [Thermosipho melanesiensis]|uniref:Ferrous iron transport protein B n=2 Tax=Thermosipho melanesiensis TaxID=46541 RepID=A6LNS7_THEM4|nr:ferrous iron transport protein B [Thermosipho melanesiensis]ABR31578.1 ferrous iron transport protein B [Thermosipho melanesiensis BI429]APT74611.1 iron transporter FeoB [Thermosipho melanesiensis]OOC35314.1 iron transporter FeoB [Thermosipho melanesiensis]OOC35532.1 iron transporter FeoB [Thermosipho melanesiensis]OOC36569.1 iron transporter FeoB [Thermosipho melanesiensis]
MVISVALVGNPNVGKTSIFNRLVGARQYVANWPGVTVTKIEGATEWRGNTLHIIDLPGTYSLTSKTIDEQVARDYLFFSPPNVTVLIADSLNPEQSFYLLIELLEITNDVILVMNSIDEVKNKKIKIDKFELEKHFGVPVVFTSAKTGEGIDELKDKIVEVANGKHTKKVLFDYRELEKQISMVMDKIPENVFKNKRYAALKYLEGDEFFKEKIDKYVNFNNFNNFATEISKIRYEYVSYIIKEAYSGIELANVKNLSYKIDHILTHKFFGIPILLLIFYFVFKFTFEIVQPLSDFLDIALSNFAEYIKSFGDNMFFALIADGIIGGVGGVLVFVPNIFGLFLMLGILEESGYLPRAAFVLDRIMYKLKLSGRAFMSLILGFGCNVPSIMTARGLPDEKERIGTIISSPFISCSARLPVYIMIISIFFQGYKAEVLFSIYLISILLTAFSAYFVNKIFFKGENVPLIMELPRYRIPTVRNILIYMWNKGSHFLKKAGTIILVTSIAVWALTYFPNNGNVETSFASYVGKGLAYVLKPLGFDWKVGTALFFGGVAKEVIVSTFSMLYGFSEGDVLSAKSALAASMNPLTAYAFLIFVLLYIPCFATLATIKSETGSWKWMIFSIMYSFSLAYLFSYIIVFFGKIFIF